MIFFSPSAYAGIFFAGETLCTNFFFQTNIALFVILLIKKNYFTKELLYFVGFNNN